MGISDLTLIVNKLFSTISFGIVLRTMLLTSLSSFLPVRNLTPRPLPSSASAVTLSEMPSDEPLPVATALTIEIAPCIVALVFLIPAPQRSQEGSFSWLLLEPIGLSISQTPLHPVRSAFRSRIQRSPVHVWRFRSAP